MVHWWNEQEKYKLINRQARKKLFGYKPKGLIGESVEILIPGKLMFSKSIPPTRQILFQPEKQRKWEMEKGVIRKNRGEAKLIPITN